MALSSEKLASIINHNAKTLCSESGQAKLSGIKSNNNFLNEDVDPNTYSDEWDNFSLSSNETNANAPLSSNISKSAYENSKIPEFIKKSMMEHKIGTDSLDSSLNEALSIASEKKTTALNEVVKTPTKVEPVGFSIDYNYIKYIVSECIREELKKQPLNEGTNLKQIGLSDGKIKLVDNKGNIFTAQLQYDGNIKNRKKKES